MKLSAVKIENFRGIKKVELDNLGNTVIIAGTNGSGKSSIFDAIRLLKSIYGGYQPNEWHHWMGEFAIQFNQSGANFDAILNDKTKPLLIECKFKIHSEERQYLENNAELLVRESIWRVIAPELYTWQNLSSVPMAAQLRARESEIASLVAQQLPAFKSELTLDVLTTQIIMRQGQPIFVLPCKTMELIFSTYLPSQLGLIDYHGPQRFFQREVLQGISLNLDAQQQMHRQSALYNYANKYTNVKTEMAGSYVQEILSEQAGIPRQEQSTLSNTLKELFKTFFPDKTFNGPIPHPNGYLEFPVTMSDGSVHDLNELSAGEKEILYGYLRIRNSAPRYSIILLDEPELHLNPKLVRGLPRFYNDYLGKALQNQIWLVTHSDALLRESVGQPDFNVFHMLPAWDANWTDGQAKPLVAGEDIERVIIDLVGDLAAYRPGGKIVVFEGGGESDFDLEMTNRLFTDFAEKTNGISGGHKTKVRSLHSILDAASASTRLPFKIYSIADRDTDTTTQTSMARYQWDRYHIECYLLEPDYIFGVLKSLGIDTFRDKESIDAALLEAARQSVPSIVRAQLTSFANDAIMNALSLSIDPKSPDIHTSLHDAARRSVERIQKVIDGEASESSLKSENDRLNAEYTNDLASEKWKSSLPGRDILKTFCQKHVRTVGYIPFRNLIISRMAESQYRPQGMQRVIDNILAD